MVKAKINLAPNMSAPEAKFFRAGRQLKEDSRTNIGVLNDLALLKLAKTRFTDEAKYKVQILQDGAVVDEADFSVFIKGY